MFEMLLLFAFFGIILWFLVPEGRTASQRHRTRTGPPPATGANPPAGSPRSEAERWFHSGRR